MTSHFALTLAAPALTSHFALTLAALAPVRLQELSSTMGVLKLAERINDPTCQEWYDGIFPKDTQV